MLLEAIKSKNLGKVRDCLSKVSNCNIRAEKLNYYSPVMKHNFYFNNVPYIVFAAQSGQIEMVKLLYNNLVQNYAKTAILSRISTIFDKSHRDVAEIQENIKGPVSLLHGAVLSGSLDMVKEAVNTYGCNPNARPSKFELSLPNASGKFHYYLTPISLAAQLGHVSIIQYLLSIGARHSIVYSIEYREYHHTEKLSAITPMAIAASSNDVELVKKLIKMNVSLEDTDHCSYTPLMQATVAGSLDVMRLLISKGANLNYRSNGWQYTTERTSYNDFAKGFSAIQLAIYQGNLDAVNILLDSGVQLFKVNIKKDQAKWNSSEMFLTPFLTAVHWNKIDVAKRILTHPKGQGTPGIKELSDALAFAIRNDSDPEFIKYLMILGANPLLRGKNKRYPVEEAVYRRSSVLLGMLFSELSGDEPLLKTPRFSWDATDEYGTLIEHQHKEYFHMHTDALRLERACRTGDLEELKAILNVFDRKVYVDVNDPYSQGNTPLHIACMHGQFTAVQFLCSKNADLNALNEAGESPVMAAIKGGKSCELIVRSLLSHGVNLGTPDRHNKTELMHAAEVGNEPIFELLLGADSAAVCSKLCDDQGNSLFLLAVRSMSSHGVTKLLEENVNVTDSNHNDDNALMIAAKNSDSKMSHLLISQGVPVDSRNKSKKTAFEIALEFKNLDYCVSLLAARLLFLVASKQIDIDSAQAFDLLFKHGADVKQRDHLNRSLLEVAVACGNSKLCEYLLDKGVEMTDEDMEGSGNNKHNYKYDLSDVVRQASTLLNIARSGGKHSEIKKLLDMYDPQLTKSKAVRQNPNAEIIPITHQYQSTHQQLAPITQRSKTKNQQKKKAPQRRKAKR